LLATSSFIKLVAALPSIVNLHQETNRSWPTGLVEITFVWTGTISVHLMDGNRECRTLLYGCDFIGSDRLLCLSTHVDIAIDLCPAT